VKEVENIENTNVMQNRVYLGQENVIVPLD